VVPLNSSFTLSADKQPSAPATHLGICSLRSGQQIGRETDLKKVLRLSARTVVNPSGPPDIAAIAEANKPNDEADAAGPRKKVSHSLPIIDSIMEGEPDNLFRVINWTW